MPAAFAARDYPPQLAKIAGEIRAGFVDRTQAERPAKQEELLEIIHFHDVLDEDMDIDGLAFGAKVVNDWWTALEIKYGERAAAEEVFRLRNKNKKA